MLLIYNSKFEAKLTYHFITKNPNTALTWRFNNRTSTRKPKTLNYNNIPASTFVWYLYDLNCKQNLEFKCGMYKN